MRWIPFPSELLPVFGLPWFRENAPELWRLPARLKGVVREPVWTEGRHVNFEKAASWAGHRGRCFLPARGAGGKQTVCFTCRRANP